jgi:hypothetical protein
MASRNNVAAMVCDVEVLAATYIVQTPCHARRVYLDEKELAGSSQRTQSVNCPRCGRIWEVYIPGSAAMCKAQRL